MTTYSGVSLDGFDDYSIGDWVGNSDVTISGVNTNTEFLESSVGDWVGNSDVTINSTDTNVEFVDVSVGDVVIERNFSIDGISIDEGRTSSSPGGQYWA